MEKRFLFYFVLLLSMVLLFSCEKESYYVVVPEEEIDTTSWDSGYTQGGTLPNNGGNNQTNDIVGTTWVITDVQTSFSSQSPNDTLYFVNNNQYTINGGAVKTYQWSLIPNSNMVGISLHYCFPIGSGIFSAQLSNTFVDDGIVYDGLFTNDYNSNDAPRLVTLIKI